MTDPAHDAAAANAGMFRNRPPSPARGPFKVPANGFGRNFYDFGVASRAEPFRGVRANAPAAAGLFPLASTGISLAPLVKAAQDYLGSLTFEQRSASLFGVESDHWRSWHNLHTYVFRHGVCLFDMSEAQRGCMLEVMRQSLGAHGFRTARDVMKLNEHMGELRGRPDDYGEWFYWMSIMGMPSLTEPWGWQIDGHHLIVNCFVLGDQIVTTPTFMGSEPVAAESGAYAGTRVFEEEERLGWRVMNSLTPQQRAVAKVGDTPPFDVFAHAFNDNLELDFDGLRFADMNSAQQRHMLELIECYVRRERPGHAELRLQEVRSHLHETWFAWIGACDEVSPFYYRVYSPVILIEFDHQPGVVYANNEHTRRHAHTLVRTPNGNDYGKALLRQYYDRVSRSPLRADGTVRAARTLHPLGDAIADLSRGDR